MSHAQPASPSRSAKRTEVAGVSLPDVHGQSLRRGALPGAVPDRPGRSRRGRSRPRWARPGGRRRAGGARRPPPRTPPRPAPTRSIRRPTVRRPPITVAERPPTQSSGSPGGSSGPAIAGTGPAGPRLPAEQRPQRADGLLQESRRAPRIGGNGSPSASCSGLADRVARARARGSRGRRSLVERRRLLRQEPRGTERRPRDEHPDAEARLPRPRRPRGGERLERGRGRARPAGRGGRGRTRRRTRRRRREPRPPSGRATSAVKTGRTSPSFMRRRLERQQRGADRAGVVPELRRHDRDLGRRSRASTDVDERRAGGSEQDVARRRRRRRRPRRSPGSSTFTSPAIPSPRRRPTSARIAARARRRRRAPPRHELARHASGIAAGKPRERRVPARRVTARRPARAIADPLATCLPAAAVAAAAHGAVGLDDRCGRSPPANPWAPRIEPTAGDDPAADPGADPDVEHVVASPAPPRPDTPPRGGRAVVLDGHRAARTLAPSTSASGASRQARLGASAGRPCRRRRARPRRRRRRHVRRPMTSATARHRSRAVASDVVGRRRDARSPAQDPRLRRRDRAARRSSCRRRRCRRPADRVAHPMSIFSSASGRAGLLRRCISSARASITAGTRAATRSPPSAGARSPRA